MTHSTGRTADPALTFASMAAVIAMLALCLGQSALAGSILAYHQPRLWSDASFRRSAVLHHVYIYAFGDVSDGANPFLRLAGALLRVLVLLLLIPLSIPFISYNGDAYPPRSS